MHTQKQLEVQDVVRTHLSQISTWVKKNLKNRMTYSRLVGTCT